MLLSPLWALLVGVVLAVPPHRALLDYSRGEGAESCPEDEALRHAVSARLGYAPWSEDAEVILHAVIRREDGTLHSHLAMVDAQGSVVGERNLTSTQADCRELAAALVLDISMAIDPRAALRPVPPPPPAPPPPRVVLVPQTPPPHLELPLPWRLTHPVQPWRYRAYGHAVTSLGAAPGLANGGVLGMALRWGGLSAGVEGQLEAPSFREVRRGRVGTARALGTLVPCAHAGWLLGCGLLSAGSVVAVGEGVPDARRGFVPYLGTGARAGLEIPVLPRLSLRLGGDGMLALHRAQLVDDRGRAYWTMPLVSGGVWVGLGSGIP